MVLHILQMGRTRMDSGIKIHSVKKFLLLYVTPLKQGRISFQMLILPCTLSCNTNRTERKSPRTAGNLPEPPAP